MQEYAKRKQISKEKFINIGMPNHTANQIEKNIAEESMIKGKKPI